MINIAVCDDSEFDINIVKKELSKYIEKYHKRINVSYFISSKALLYELDDGKTFDIFILDVSMPEKDGFQLAEYIRARSETAVIIFLTSHEEQALNGYKFKALRYILKLNLNDDFEEAIDCAVKDVEKIDDSSIILHYYNDIRKIPYNEIVCVNRISRQLVITTNEDGEFTDSRGINEFYEELNDNRFLFIDRSCFVNIDYITQITGFNIKMKNGLLVHVSRRSLQKVKEAIMKQWNF